MSYGSPQWRLGVLLVAALAAVGGAIFIPELWALVAVLLASAVRDWWYRSALVVGTDGLRCVDGLTKRFVTWESLVALRVRQERHWLAFARNLEIDLSDETLILLSRGQLGAEPEEVARVLEATWQAALQSGT
jgi:hypothetical protein